ncbi:hypothetical protein [Ferrimonas aestuarii]|uniref:Uncharacterized protein n=1 Tax=Ferrimonas aestuarii TaxID=2569539 RepID=A0A4U1BNG6_9GAMM|nr:hypothetical protein [Ferrimonas aestuarii]TKB53312.1 hypothetical protein FCL42_14680 [Ferrimonas aestuarii]
MRWAIIENQRVINVTLARSALAANWVIADDAVCIGDGYRNGQFDYQRPPQRLVPVVLTGVSGAGLVANKSDFSLITVRQGQTVTVTGTLAIPDQGFNLPVRRAAGGYELFRVEVVDGAFAVDLNFATSDAYLVTDAELNKDLPEAQFSLAPTVSIDVLRQID